MTPLFTSKRSVENGVQVAWDATSLELAQTCQRKYYYKMIRGLQPKRLSVHLLFGGLYATALEHFYIHRASGDSIDEALRKVIRETMTASWKYETKTPVHGEREIPTDENILRNADNARIGHVRDFEHKAKTRPNLVRTIVWYIEQFAEETEDGLSTYHLASGKPAVELSFTIEANSDFLFCGHLDRVVTMGGTLYVADQKTTGGTVGTYFFDQFSPNNQMSMYSWAGQQVLASPIRGVIIDAAQIAVNFTRFERGITTRSKDQLSEWYESTMETIYTTNENVRAEKFPMNLSACGNYGGCEFRYICSRAPGVRENYLKSDFVPHNWDPLKAR